jgi:hypothetical protein
VRFLRAYTLTDTTIPNQWLRQRHRLGRVEEGAHYPADVLAGTSESGWHKKAEGSNKIPPRLRAFFNIF